MGLRDFKRKKAAPSQASMTHSQTLIARFNEKTARFAERYRAAHAALVRLDPEGDWRSHLRILNDKDIKSPVKGDDKAENTRVISWIWRVGLKDGGQVSTAALKTASSNQLGSDVVDGKHAHVFLYVHTDKLK
jgi:hypothetical protein